MSHRATFESEIKKAEILRRALNKANITFTENGGRFTLRGGAYNNTVIDTTTGRIVGADTDHNRAATDETIGSLRQMYAVEDRLEQHFLSGTVVKEQKTITRNNQKIIVLCCSKQA